MKAIILNSGKGERLYPLTKDKPKALIVVGGKAILGRQLDNLAKCNIRDIIITTGPFVSKIKDYIKKEYSSLRVSYVRNPKYSTANYLYSMWLTKGLIDDNIILLHGDLLFDCKLLQRLLEARHRNCVLVGKGIKSEKDFKAVIKGDRVVRIGVDVSGDFCAPCYKFCKADFLFWLNEIEKHVKAEDLSIYAEDVFNEISGRIALHPVFFDREICLEIDTREDLRIAEALLS